MHVNRQRLAALLDTYVKNHISPEDLRELATYIQDHQSDPLLLTALEEAGFEAPEILVLAEEQERIYQNIITSPAFNPQAPSGSMFSWKLFSKLSAAAAIIACIGTAWYFYKTSEKEHKPLQQIAVNEKIDMGSNTAVLTLADGSKVVLDKNGKGLIARQGNSSINQDLGMLKYEASQTGATARPLLNTINIPKASAYQLILSDGTKVWLNASSSLTYPIAFTGKTREVSVVGEAYFEVAHNAAKPFIVKSALAAITVLGTHFNVKAYPAEKMITTLLSGSVKVARGQQAVTIRPDQEASIAQSDGRISIAQTDSEDAIAWKSGYFLFRNENIKDVMRTISHWYNIDVEYQGDMTGKTFGGTIARLEDIDGLLRGIELTGAIHFKKEGRRVIVMP